MNTHVKSDATFQGSLTPVCIVGYLALHAIWSQCVFGPYSFVYLRLFYLAGIAGLLLIGGRPAEIRAYFVGRILPQNGILGFAVMLLGLVAVRMADVALRVWAHMATTYNPDRLFGECLVAPLNEEIVFRGIFLAVLLQQMSRQVWLAILIDALVTASVHNLILQNAFSVDLFLALFIVNTLLGWIYFRTRSVLCCIFAHSLWNVFSFIPFSHG